MEVGRVSYMHQPSPKRLEHRTISQMLDKRAAEHAQKEAIILYDEQRQRHCLTFSQFQRQSQSLAATLLAKGLGRGDNVGLFLPNCLEFAVSFMALNRIGANVVVIPQGGSAEYIKGVLVQLKCVGLLCYVDEDETKRKALMDAIHDMKKTGLIGDGEYVMKCMVTLGAQVKWEAPTGLVHQYEELLSSQQPKDMNLLEKTEQSVQFDDPAVVLLTSGSAGLPKACQFTNQSVTVALDIFCTYLNFSSRSRRFICSPFSWVPGLGSICAIASVGAACVSLPPALLLKDTATEFILSVLSSERCTSGFLLPSLICDVVNNSLLLKKFDLGCFESVSTGGQVLSHGIVSKFLNLFPNLVLNLGYGATETFGLISNATCKENVSNSEELGWMEIAPNFEVKVVDPNGRILPVCTALAGEILIRGPAIFQEYLEDSQATSSSKSRTGWWSSGDVGVMDDKGRIKIYGRTGDAINRATDTVYPAEFEVDIAKHPLVAKVVVVGVPDQRLYEEVCACVILKDHGHFESQKFDLEEWYNEMWPDNADGTSWKPGYTIYLNEFPLTGTMKPDRRVLRKIAVEKLGLEEEK